jgi:alpha-galactosidase
MLSLNAGTLKTSSFAARWIAAFAILLSPVFLHATTAAETNDEAGFHRRWTETVFSPTAPSLLVDRLHVIKEGHAGDTKFGNCSTGGPLRLGDKVYSHGIGVNSHCVLRVTLTRPAQRFIADVGMDRNVDGTAASSAFHVAVEGKDVFATKVLRPADGMQKIDVPLKGATQFDLIVDEGGDGRGWDQGDWADARVVLQDGSELWLDDIARKAHVQTDLPFSFVYGGRPSAELLGKWTRKLAAEKIDETRLCRTLTLTDPETGLEVRAEAICYLDTPAVEWTLHFTNRGAKDSPIIENVKAIDLSVGFGSQQQAVLHRLVGSPCRVDDWMPLEDAITPDKPIEFATVGGRSSSGASPFFTLQWPGGGVVTAIGWTGQWIAKVERDINGLRLSAGMQSMHLKLHPGESVRSPRIMQVFWQGDDLFRGYNLFRQTMLAHVVPRRDGSPVVPPIAHMSTSFYELNDSTEANTLSHIEPLHGLGFEVLWLDAYWTRGGFPAGMGNYGFPLSIAESPAYPRGIKPISEAARKEGMKFLLWFEPERVAPGTYIAKEHPQWVISPSGDGSGLINLGMTEAREHLTKYLTAVIKEYDMTWLRIDYNLDPLGYWQFLDNQDPDRVGMAEIRYNEGLYRLWDDLLAACPNLAIDNCASGGKRIDLETCSRSLPLWRTDATIGPLLNSPKDYEQAAMQNQVMTAGLNRYLPFHVSGQMGASPYNFRSGFNGGIAFAEDCRPAAYPRELLKEAIAEGKRVRKYYFGNFYSLSDVTLDVKGWCIMQYHRPKEADGMIVAFRRPQSPYSAYVADFREIDPKAEYEITRSTTYQPSKPEKISGEKLRQLKIEIDERPGSIILEYRRIN